MLGDGVMQPRALCGWCAGVERWERVLTPPARVLCMELSLFAIKVLGSKAELGIVRSFRLEETSEVSSPVCTQSRCFYVDSG